MAVADPSSLLTNRPRSSRRSPLADRQPISLACSASIATPSVVSSATLPLKTLHQIDNVSRSIFVLAVFQPIRSLGQSRGERSVYCGQRRSVGESLVWQLVRPDSQAGVDDVPWARDRDSGRSVRTKLGFGSPESIYKNAAARSGRIHDSKDSNSTAI